MADRLYCRKCDWKLFSGACNPVCPECGSNLRLWAGLFPEEKEQEAQEKMGTSGWIGVDLDGTLAEYHGWNGGHIGDPIPAMVKRVKGWLAEGITVKIFTARVTNKDPDTIYRIQEWCMFHGMGKLPVTNVKDWACIELWDDRAVRVVPNTGQPCCFNH